MSSVPDSDPATIIGQRIRQVFQESSITAADFSRETAISPFTISQWFRGRHITIDTLFLLSNRLHVSLNWLIFGHGDKNPPSSLDINDREHDLITTLRHIDTDISQSVMYLLKSINNYHANTHRIEHSRDIEKLLNASPIATLTVLLDGTIKSISPVFTQWIEVDCTPTPCSIYSIVSTEFHFKLKRDIDTLLSEGVTPYTFYQLNDKKQQRPIAVIAKSTLVQFNGQLAFEMLIKQVDHG